MQLYFLRHGIAEDRQPGQEDSQRHLTPEGEAEMRAIAAGLAKLNIKLDKIATSPLTRALQTAHIVADVLGLTDRFAVDPRLGGGCGLYDLAQILHGLPQKGRALLVGHEPDFSEMVSELIGGASIEFKKGGLARVDADSIDPGNGVLQWLLVPKHFTLCE
ncbi:MAG: phosphohistidine phosphatase SixA [Armatimonadetes bacterium]|nr:phosphohistidine phosphatase SixA [Armatimonadota bacterium]